MSRIYIFLMILFALLGFSACSTRSKELEAGIQLSTYEEEGFPYTDVTFIIRAEDEKEEILIGSYMGEGFHIDTFENRSFFHPDSLVGCQVFYAGGGYNVFAYVEDGELIVKHIEFMEGSEGNDSGIVDERIIVRKLLPKSYSLKAMGSENPNKTTHFISPIPTAKPSSVTEAPPSKAPASISEVQQVLSEEITPALTEPSLTLPL